MKAILAIIAIGMLQGCTCNLAWRGVIATTNQRATTDGEIKNDPQAGDTSIAAEKTTDANLDLPLK